MKTVYKKQDVYLHYISLDEVFVLGTRDPGMKNGFFKINCSEIKDKKILKKLKKKYNKT